jgi:hypothetical protein
MKIIMDKCVLHLDFYAIYMDDVDIVLGYPWMDRVGTFNMNVKQKFLRLWYEKKKITLHDISLTKQEGPKNHLKSFQGNKLQYLMTH